MEHFSKKDYCYLCLVEISLVNCENCKNEHIQLLIITSRMPFRMTGFKQDGASCTSVYCLLGFVFKLVFSKFYCVLTPGNKIKFSVD